MRNQYSIIVMYGYMWTQTYTAGFAEIFRIARIGGAAENPFVAIKRTGVYHQADQKGIGGSFNQFRMKREESCCLTGRFAGTASRAGKTRRLYVKKCFSSENRPFIMHPNEGRGALAQGQLSDTESPLQELSSSFKSCSLSGPVIRDEWITGQSWSITGICGKGTSNIQP